MNLKQVAEGQPPTGHMYLVLRGTIYFTASVCYGMHAPWWVSIDWNGEEKGGPVMMEDSDLWIDVREAIRYTVVR